MEWVKFTRLAVSLIVLDKIIKLARLFGINPKRIYNIYINLDIEMAELVEENDKIYQSKVYKWLVKNTQ